MNDASTISKNKEPYSSLEDNNESIIDDTKSTRPIQLQMADSHVMSKYDCISGEQMTKGSSKIYPVQMQMPNDIIVNIDEPNSSFNNTKSKQSEQANQSKQSKQPVQPKRLEKSKKNNNEESCLLCCSCCCETADDIATCYLYMWLINSMQHDHQGNSSLPCLCKCDCCDGFASCDCSGCDCSGCDCDCNF